MKCSDLARFTTAVLLLAVAVITGCKKAQPSQTATSPDNGASTAPAAAPASAPANQAGAAAAPTIDTTRALADVNTALKAKDYEKATENLLALQRQKQLTEQQAMAVRGQMVQLQSAVSAGLSKGDPNAKAAADRLRAAAMQP
jgi:hypothetical protein